MCRVNVWMTCRGRRWPLAPVGAVVNRATGPCSFFVIGGPRLSRTSWRGETSSCIYNHTGGMPSGGEDDDEGCMSLDNDFGPMLPPGRPVQFHEIGSSPKSLTILKKSSAAKLKQYLEGRFGLPIVSVFPLVFPVLWIIEADGKIKFAVEEIFDAQGQFIGVLPKIAKPIPDTVKLGHPSMLEDPECRARIGGDIVYDPIPGLESFVIRNKSGRYGFRQHQTEAHLAAVASKFAAEGLHFRLDYIPPMSAG
jgi:hypothetical protein